MAKADGGEDAGGCSFRTRVHQHDAIGANLYADVRAGSCDHVEVGANADDVKHDIKKVTVGMNKRYTLEAAQRLRGSELPILFTWAPGDRLFPISYAERLAGEVANARIVQIPDAGTFVPLDQPERLADEIAAFVD